LGFDSAFFRAILPRHGLGVSGIFSSWDDLPERPVAASSSNVIIVRAARLPPGVVTAGATNAETQCV
jgi:hypothetical protein